MKRSEFNEKFDSIISKLIDPLTTKEGLLKMFENYTKDSNKTTLEEMFTILFVESRKYTNDVVYQLFSEFLDIED